MTWTDSEVETLQRLWADKLDRVEREHAAEIRAIIARLDDFLAKAG
jgi:hypothetical protein